MKRNLKITFLGGARRVTLLEKIREITSDYFEIEFISIEKDKSFYPISSNAEVIAGPKYSSDDFDKFLYEHLKSKKSTCLACMDAAIPSLSKLNGKDFGSGEIITSSIEGALISLNKLKTNEFCKKQKINHPLMITSANFQDKNLRLIAKPFEGYGAKGIHILENYDRETIKNLEHTHLIQELIDGDETTHDVYIFKNFSFISSSRDRLAVIDGEVDHCIVRETDDSEKLIIQKIAETRLFMGPITVQTIKSHSGSVFLIEVNSRLGGGVTASISAGFPIIQAIIKESLEIEIPVTKFYKLEMKRARRDFYNLL